MDCSMPGFLSFTISQSLLKLMYIELVMPSNHLIVFRPLLLSSIFPSIRVFSNDLALHISWPRYWSFSFSIHPSNEYSGLTFLRIDWFDLAVQGTLKSLSQHRVWKHQFFSAQSFLWSKSHIHAWLLEKIIALTIWTFIEKVISLLYICCPGLSSEKAMAPHSSTLAWKIPWMEEPGRLQSMGLWRVGHDWATSLSLSF